MLNAIVDLAFPIQGESIPADHGYLLYAALSTLQPAFHGASWLGVHPIKGLASGANFRLPPGSKLRLRLPANQVPCAVSLIGQTLSLGACQIRLGAPELSVLRPAAGLYSRLVVIKGFLDPEPYRLALQRQIDALGAQCRAAVGPRRTLRVKDRIIVGFAVSLSELSAEESIDVQERGLGGRRHMGCGVFAPFRGAWR
jgi:CRISPR-associated protein Cas6